MPNIPACPPNMPLGKRIAYNDVVLKIRSAETQVLRNDTEILKMQKDIQGRERDSEKQQEAIQAHIQEIENLLAGISSEGEGE